jgi:hypothetical protein
MGTADIIFYAAGAVCFILSIINGLSLVIMRNKVKPVIGTIVDIKTTNSETMRVVNSKWAHMLYQIDGKDYVSENRIFVPMSAIVGQKMKIKYIIDKPHRLYGKSIKIVLIYLLIAILCTVLAYLLGRA